MMQAIAGKTFFEIMYLEVLIFFYFIFYINRKKKGEALFLSLYLFSFYQSIRYFIGIVLYSDVRYRYAIRSRKRDC